DCNSLPGWQLTIPAGSRHCFFFQAEDGIRDLIVTGVQTCALPIFLKLIIGFSRPMINFRMVDFPEPLPPRMIFVSPLLTVNDTRSEERRVGKECRSWDWPDFLKQ